MTDVRQRLRAMGEEDFGDFTARTIPTVPREQILGVRTPALRALARELVKAGEGEALLAELPHRFFEENQLHAFVLGLEKDFDRCLAGVERFLPYVDNWATCDQCNPAVFRKHRQELLPAIDRWLEAEQEYTVRFGIKMLMDHFLEEDFLPEYLDRVAEIRREEYYIRMMQAWYFATALAKQWEAALPVVEGHRLEGWVHNKTIQKAVESDRISPEKKAILRELKRKE